MIVYGPYSSSSRFSSGGDGRQTFPSSKNDLISIAVLSSVSLRGWLTKARNCPLWGYYSVSLSPQNKISSSQFWMSHVASCQSKSSLSDFKRDFREISIDLHRSWIDIYSGYITKSNQFGNLLCLFHLIRSINNLYK